MKKAAQKVAGRSAQEWEDCSRELGKEMAGAPENTQPLSPKERRWYRTAVAKTGRKGGAS